MPSQHVRPQVVILGGGFGGLYAARHLARHPVQITVVDRKNYHTFQPLLYQVATAALSPADIASPIRSILKRHENVEVLLGEAVGFDLERHMVKLRELELTYDYLVVATGAQHSYFGHDDWEPLAPGLKTIEDALEMRRRVLLVFEIAEREAAKGLPPDPLNFVIVGGGPTGVELAGALAEIARKALARDFRSIDPKRARVVLVEAAPRVLPTYPEDLSREAQRELENLGVEVHTATSVTGVAAGCVRIGETPIPAALTLWAAGVAASPLGRQLGVPTTRHGQVPVGPDLSLAGHPEVFVIGDLAAATDEAGHPLPGLAAVATQEGKYVANTIARDLAHEPRRRFHYVDKGILATIGRAAAVASFGKIHLTGFVAWLSWLFIHLMLLIGFRNRLLVLVQWAWSYVTYQRGIRLITGSTDLPRGRCP